MSERWHNFVNVNSRRSKFAFTAIFNILKIFKHRTLLIFTSLKREKIIFKSNIFKNYYAFKKNCNAHYSFFIVKKKNQT